MTAPTAPRPDRTPAQRRDDRAAARRGDRASEARAAVASLGLFMVMMVVVVAILMSQFGTVRDASSEVVARDETVGGSGPELSGGWRAVRGTWAVAADGARVARPGPQLSVAVRPLGGVEGTVIVDGVFGASPGWAVVVRWDGPGTYALVVVEPDEGTVSVVGVVDDRTRLLGQGALPEGAEERTVEVTMTGPVIEARVDGTLVAAGRDDDLTKGTSAGVAVLGDVPGARFARFRSAPPEPARTLVPTSVDGS